MQPQHESKTKLLEATLRVVRAKGYNATRIEDVCTDAGLTKGSFFHHFKSKEDLALAAVAHWNARSTGEFAAAPYHDPDDPRDRLLAYVDFRKAILKGDLPEFTCFAGTIVQEVYGTHPEIRAACEETISGHARTLEADIREAMRKYDVRGDWTAEKSRAPHSVRHPGRLHPRQGERERRRGGREPRPSASLFPAVACEAGQGPQGPITSNAPWRGKAAEFATPSLVTANRHDRRTVMRIYWIKAQAPRRVLALVKHLGVNAEFVEVDMMAGGFKMPDYVALNPNMKAPTLVDGDLVLWESPRRSWPISASNRDRTCGRHRSG